MRVVLRMSDGTEEVREVASLDLQLGDRKLEVEPGSDPLRLQLHVPCSEQSLASFVVHHRCANTMTVEVRPNVRSGHAAAG